MAAACIALFAQVSSDSLPIIEQLIARGQFQEALRRTESLPLTVQRHLLASKALDGLGDAARAVAEAEKALALDPRSEAAHLQLGQIFLGNNTPQAALEVFTDALQLHPNSFLLRTGRGLALKDLNLYDEAIAELKRCLEAKPGFAVCFDGLATSLLNAKRFDELSTAAAEQEKVNPTDYRAPYFAAAAKSAAGAPSTEIMPLLDRSIERNKRFAAAHALLGRVLLQEDEINRATVALENAVALRPDYAPALLNLAQAYKKAGREQDAARIFDRLREVNEKERAGKPALIYRRGAK